MVVIDCSITMAWLFEDEKTEKTEKILDEISSVATAIVPSIWLLEVTNTLLVAEKRQRITTAQAMHFWQTLKSLSIKFERHASYEIAESVLNLARIYRLSSYDAAYLNLAITHNVPLATLDKSLLAGAKACGIEIY